MQVNLVLGSGGARGFAHVGVIHELQARGHEVVGISGTSMGALVGGVLAAGKLDEFADYCRTLTRSDVRRLTDLTLGSSGLVRLQKAMNELHRFVGDARIEDLPVPFTAVATDIDLEREVWFRTGSLLAAIRASIAIPAVFTPVRIGERLLVDGGLLNPLPIGPTMDMPGQLTVGVSLFAKPPGLWQVSPSNESADTASAEGETLGNDLVLADAPHQSWSDRLGVALADSWVGKQVAKHLAPQGPAVEKDFEDLPTDVNLVDMLGRTLDLMQARIELARNVLNAPDVLTGVPTNSCSVLDFDRAGEMMQFGRRLAVAEFDRVGL
jgi:NTE family protein